MTETSDYTDNNYHLFSEIFGTERLPDTFPMSLDTSARIRAAVHSSGTNTNMSTSNTSTGSDTKRHVKFSSLIDFNDLLLEDITQDLMLNTSNTDELGNKTVTGLSSSSSTTTAIAAAADSHISNTDSDQFVLSQETCIKNVADTQSLSSTDMTSTSSPNGDRSNSTLSIPNKLPRDRNNNSNNNNTANSSTTANFGTKANGSQVHMSSTAVPSSVPPSSVTTDVTGTNTNTTATTNTTTAVHPNSRSPPSSASNGSSSKRSNDSIMKARVRTTPSSGTNATTVSSNGKKTPTKHDSNDQRRKTSTSTATSTKANLSSPLSPSNRASGSISTVDTGVRKKQQQQQQQTLKNAYKPKKKHSFPQLSLSALQRQPSNVSTPATPTSQSKKSPLQGFGLFSLLGSRDSSTGGSFSRCDSTSTGGSAGHLNGNTYEQQNSMIKNRRKSTPSIMLPNHGIQTLPPPHTLRSTSSSLTLNFRTKAKNMPGTYQQNNRRTPQQQQQQYDSPVSTDLHGNGSSFYHHVNSSNGPLSPGSLGAPNLPFSSRSLKGNNFNNNNNTNNNNGNNTGHGHGNSVYSSPVGLGIQSKNSSTSLNVHRYFSTSTNSLHNHYHHSTGGSGSSGHSHSGSHHSQVNLNSMRHGSYSPGASSCSRRVVSSSSKRPQVNPVLLSKVAAKFKELVQVGDYKKDGLVYRDSFTGQHAVDVLCSIIRTSDRNLALLLGRSLDAQKLFHDVVYEHRLRDSPYEVYEFTDSSRILGTGKAGVLAMGPNDPLMLLPSSSSKPGSVNAVSQNTQELSSSSSSTSLMSNQTYSTTMSSVPNTAGVSTAAKQSAVPVPLTHTLSRSSTTTTGTSVTAASAPVEVQLQQQNSTLNNINGVFTLLAECYSPTCSRDKLCYSISCPRRLEQQARLNLKPNGGLKRNISMALDDDEEEKPSWTSSVSEEVWKNLPKKEIKRQEAIYEVFITERNFVKSLEVTRDTFMKTLAETNIIPADIRKNFIKHVFAHINDIYSVNRRFLEALSDRQKSSPVCKGIGDIFLRFIPFFEPFVSYVASRPYAKYLIETQRSVNPYFARFDDDMMNSSLRHGIDSFLSQGVSRPGRYMLLVREIIKSSDPEKDKRDLENLNKATEALRAFMRRIDKASGAAQDRHDVKLLKQKILFKNEYVNMGLNDEKRKIKHEGVLSRKEITKSDSAIAGDVQFYLLDNMLLFLKAKAVNKWHQHKVFQRPIPLPLLFVCPGEDMPSLRKYIGNSPDSSGTVVTPEYNVTNPRNAVTFLYYGAKQRYQVTLFAPTYAGLQTLLEKIRQEQQRILQETSMINITKISDKFFDYSNKINSVASCDGGRKLLIATNSGLYMSNIKRQEHQITDSGSPSESGGSSNKNRSSVSTSTSHGDSTTTSSRSTSSSSSKKPYIYFSTPIQLVQRNNITRVAVLEEFKSILLLVDKKLYSVPLKLIACEVNGTSYFKKHAKELMNHVNFFSEGDCNGKRLIVTAHTSSHSIKFFELEHPLLTNAPSSTGNNTSSKRGVRKKITEVVFDSEPVSISFLKANLCIGCKKGFQIVSISQNAHESLLDPADTSLEFALKDTLKPIAIYRVGNIFLLCYTEFAFFVNNQGWRKKDSHIIYWEGEPQKFAVWYPYILAFDSNFIEIRKIDTGELVRCILGDKIRLLQTNTQEILYVYEDARGYDTVASLDFWG